MKRKRTKKQTTRKSIRPRTKGILNLIGTLIAAYPGVIKGGIAVVHQLIEVLTGG